MSNQLDTRELQERLEELENLETELVSAKEALQEAEDALEEYENTDDAKDKRLGEGALEDKVAETQEAVDDIDFDDTELAELRALKDEIGSEWKYGVQLIPVDDFTDYCQEMLEDCGDLPKDLPSYIIIDWDETAENLKADYAETEFRGETYLYRV